MSKWIGRTVWAVREIVVGVDAANAVLHGVPVPERARRRAPGHKH